MTLDDIADDIDNGEVARGGTDRLDDIDEWARKGLIENGDGYEWFRRGLKTGGIAGGITGGVFVVAIYFCCVVIVWLLFGRIVTENPINYKEFWEFLCMILVLEAITRVVIVLAGASGGGIAGAVACRVFKGKDRLYKKISKLAGVIGGVAGIVFCLLALGSD